MAKRRVKDNPDHPAYPMVMAASCVLFITFLDGQVRTYYSKDIEKEKDNLWYWSNWARNKAEVEYVGKVRSWAVFRSVNGVETGDPIFKSVNYQIFN